MKAVVIMKALEVGDQMWGGQKPVQHRAIYPAGLPDRTASAFASPTHGSINNIDRAAALSMGLQCGHEKKDKETTSFMSEQSLLLAINRRVWGKASTEAVRAVPVTARLGHCHRRKWNLLHAGSGQDRHSGGRTQAWGIAPQPEPTPLQGKGPRRKFCSSSYCF